MRTDAQRSRARAWYLTNRQLTIDRSAAWAKAHPESYKASRKKYDQSEKGKARNQRQCAKYFKANKEFCNRLCREWYAANPEKKQQQRKEWNARTGFSKRYSAWIRETLPGFYVRELLSRSTKVKPKDWPAVLVELKRALIKVHRETKGR